MVKRKTWEEFRQAGLLWWVNRGLHLFGWAIVIEMNDDRTDGREEILAVYPARVKFRGFGQANEEDGFRRLTKHLKDTAEELLKEAEE